MARLGVLWGLMLSKKPHSLDVVDKLCRSVSAYSGELRIWQACLDFPPEISLRSSFIVSVHVAILQAIAFLIGQEIRIGYPIRNGWGRQVEVLRIC